MKTKKVISRKNEPTKFPITLGIVLYLLLKGFNIPSWGWGIYATLMVLLIIGTIISMSQEKEIDLFNKDDDKLTFDERIEKLRNEKTK
jgi:hypothetical protein